MKALVVYDSTFGNTEIIAQAIAQALGADARRAASLTPADLSGFDLVVIGAPTNGGQATPAMRAFLKSLDKQTAGGLAVATFDTRDVHRWVSIFGYAAKRMSKHLAGLGARPVAAPEGFFVTGTRGPLKDGEVERAAAWAARLAAPSG
jgi:flavodoxin I